MTREAAWRVSAEKIPSREEIENFLYNEAALLDDWRLEEWLALFTEDCRYVVPSTDRLDTDEPGVLVLVDDDRTRLKGRVERLNSRKAHREFPWSRTRRLITNIRIVGVEGDEIAVLANFLVYRVRNNQVHSFMGQYRYTLTRVDGELRIRLRRAELDLESLRPHGTLSIIL